MKDGGSQQTHCRRAQVTQPTTTTTRIAGQQEPVWWTASHPLPSSPSPLSLPMSIELATQLFLEGKYVRPAPPIFPSFHLLTPPTALPLSTIKNTLCSKRPSSNSTRPSPPAHRTRSPSCMPTAELRSCPSAASRKPFVSSPL